jgi:hypothetical protein
LEHQEMTVKELIEDCESKRIENTKEYKDSVKASNELIRNYQLQQAKIYKEAESYYVN